MKVLITGKNSYIGNSFQEYVREHYPGIFQVYAVGMRDGAWRKLDFAGYDAVLHVAGIAHADVGKVTEEGKAEYYKVNRDLALEAAGKAKAAGVRQFVFMSSMIVYGNQERVTKETKACPANFYGDSKWQADVGVRELAGESFQVAVLRPPMIYGRGSKGNYPVLAKMAKRLPVFPKAENRRSMLYIENLCEFLCKLIQDGRGGIFFPQNKELVSTGKLVREIAECAGHKIWITCVLVPFTAVGKRLPGKGFLRKIRDLCRKAFGSCYYDLDMSETEWEYRVADFKESIRRTEAE